MNSTIALLGALGANARRDTDAHASKMRSAFREGFRDGHSCRLCPRVSIPDDVTDCDRERRANVLWRAHWIRMRAARHRDSA
jgi:hypothetical protein